ncbi:MAG: formate--tetrahydrofolate ligase [Gammaproteobacteria bacterium]|nr:formate--tetrahydrofolate ligase [Gammaproteobacteria bacterium]
MKTDIQIEKATPKLPISEVAGRLGLGEDDYLPHGRHIAKLPYSLLKQGKRKARGKLVLVTAMSPTPSGEGKTTTSIGLTDALNLIGRKASLAVREPSLGPYFGIKGGGTGGGKAQIVPAEDINLHFTGDIAAVAKSANLLAALIDNHLHHANKLGIDQRRITWKRVVDLNDRALRDIVIGLGGPLHGVPRKDGFYIAPASEIMAILCMATSFPDLRGRIKKIIFGYTRDRQPLTCEDLGVDAAMSVLLRDAILPNLVQTLGHSPTFVHGGPFANIAHGCSSVIASRLGLQMSDFLITEAGFGSDLGAEKFFNLKCRLSGLRPDVAVIVATLKAVEFHGGYSSGGGWDNLSRHIDNVRQFGVTPVVAINRFPDDSPRTLNRLRKACEKKRVRCAVSDVYRNGGEGGVELAEAVKAAAARSDPKKFKLLYPDKMKLRDKIQTIARKVYGARGVNYTKEASGLLDHFEEMGFGKLPICMAKTPMSFTDNPTLVGARKDFDITVTSAMLSAGAGFVVAIAGNVIPMPGLPKVPAALRVRIDDEGNLIDMA